MAKPLDKQVVKINLVELLFKIALLIFIVELVIMFVLPYLPLPDSLLLEASLDASVLSLLTVILLFLWLKTDRLFLSRAYLIDLKIFLLYSIPAIITLCIIFLVSHNILTERNVIKEINDNKHVVNDTTHRMDKLIDTGIKAVGVLKTHIERGIQNNNYLSSFKKQSITQLFLDYAMFNKEIMQIRVLDLNGDEIIRVERGLDGNLISFDELQNKKTGTILFIV